MILQIDMTLSLCLIIIICATGCDGIIGCLLGIWVYKDAKKRELNAPAWFIIVLLTSIIGLIVYLLYRKKKVE